jgi:hypothetical protein
MTVHNSLWTVHQHGLRSSCGYKSMLALLMQEITLKLAQARVSFPQSYKQIALLTQETVNSDKSRLWLETWPRVGMRKWAALMQEILQKLAWTFGKAALLMKRNGQICPTLAGTGWTETVAGWLTVSRLKTNEQWADFHLFMLDGHINWKVQNEENNSKNYFKSLACAFLEAKLSASDKDLVFKCINFVASSIFHSS